MIIPLSPLFLIKKDHLTDIIDQWGDLMLLFKNNCKRAVVEEFNFHIRSK